jgi:hypothetical protein
MLLKNYKKMKRIFISKKRIYVKSKYNIYFNSRIEYWVEKREEIEFYNFNKFHNDYLNKKKKKLFIFIPYYRIEHFAKKYFKNIKFSNLKRIWKGF